MKKRGGAKKAQVTLFIILAILIVIGIGTYIFLSRQTTGINLLSRAAMQANALAKSDAVKLYVETCLEEATKEAVLTIGRQGGYIYDYQSDAGVAFLAPEGELCMLGGFLPPENCQLGSYIIQMERTDGSGIIDNVSFMIKNNSDMPIPFYPYPGYLHATDLVDTFGKVVGGTVMGSPLALCNTKGANSRLQKGAEQSCFGSYSSKGISVQSLLEGYISEKVMECADFSGLTFSQGMTIIADKATTDVIFGETGITANIHYSMEIQFESNQAVATIADYSYRMDNLRFKQIYELAYYLVKADTSSIFFDKSSEGDLMSLTNCIDPLLGWPYKTFCLKDGMSLSIIEDPCKDRCSVNRYADIIQITDQNSIINGEPYIFQFAVGNRRPALDSITYTPDASTPIYAYLVNNYGIDTSVYKKRTLVTKSELGYDIILAKQDLLEIYPRGVDPDEEALKYRYSKYEGEPTDLHKMLEDSAIYQTTNRDASISVDSLVAGDHVVGVVITDGEGLSDFHNIRIMVCETDPSSSYYCI